MESCAFCAFSNSAELVPLLPIFRRLSLHNDASLAGCERTPFLHLQHLDFGSDSCSDGLDLDEGVLRSIKERR